MSNRETLQQVIDRMHLQWFADGDAEAAKRFSETDEGKAWFKEHASSAGLMTPEEVETAKTGVANKNAELIKKNKRLTDKNADLEDKGTSLGKLTKILADYDIPIDDDGELDYDSIEEALQRQRRAGDGDGDPGKLDELQRQTRKAQRDLEESERKLKAAGTTIEERDTTIGEKDSSIATLLIDGAFKTALAIHGYSELTIPYLLPSLRDKSKAEVQLDEETGEYRAITDDGSDIGDWVKSWKDSDEGKALRVSAQNAGGGGRGSSGGGKGGTWKPWGELSVTERTKLHTENVDLYHKIKNEAAEAKKE